jgi:hypothetical protein
LNFVYGIDDIRRAGSLMESGMRTTINLHPRRDRASLVFATAPCVGSGVSLVNLFGALDACVDVPFRSHEISGLGECHYSGNLRPRPLVTVSRDFVRHGVCFVGETQKCSHFSAFGWCA